MLGKLDKLNTMVTLNSVNVDQIWKPLTPFNTLTKSNVDYSFVQIEQSLSNIGAKHQAVPNQQLFRSYAVHLSSA